MRPPFAVDAPDGEVQFSSAGAAAEYLFEHRFADPDREPHWHVRWCLERLARGESMDVGLARVTRC